MWPRHPRKHPSRQKIEKRFRNESNPIPALKFRNASTTMTVHPRFQIPIAKKLLVNTIHLILLRFDISKCHSIYQRVAYYTESITQRDYNSV